MDMHDKELDNLFRSKLDDFETEPSARVWQNIDAELQTSKRKKIVWLPFLSVAASVVVLVSAGLFFITHGTKVNSHQPKTKLAARPAKQVKEQVAANTAAATVIANKAQTPAIKQVKSLPVQHLVTKSMAPQHRQDSIAPKQPVVAPAPQKMMAAIPDTHGSFTQPAIKADSVPSPVKLLAVQPVAVKPAAIATNTLPGENPNSIKQQRKRRHILSLGDMVNTVIAAVDKRKDKFIEFSDTDDDESTITGVNLGLIAVKKQN